MELKEKRKNIIKIEKNEFVFKNIAHEIRTPLTLIMSPLEDELKRTNNSNISIALKNSKRLYKLINQLLEIQKSNSPGNLIKLQPINLVYFLSKCSELFLTTAKTKGISFKLTLNGKVIDPTKPTSRVIILLANKDSLEKIIFNFLSNGLKHCKGKPIELCLKEENEKIFITVKDQGDGIPEDQQSKIFEMFNQVEKNRNNSGFGIGLSLVKTLAEKMNGQAGVSSKPGNGSEFWVRFDKYKPKISEFIFLIDEQDFPKIHILLNLLERENYHIFNYEIEVLNFLKFNSTNTIIYNPNLTSPQLFKFINQSLPDISLITLNENIKDPLSIINNSEKCLKDKATRVPVIPEKSFDILIVEDDEDICELYETIVGEITSSFVIAHNIKEAKSIISKYNFKGILCDAGLPDGNGVDILEEITKIFPDTHRILVTGKDDGPLLQMAINKGQVDKAIFKPWDTQELTNDIKKALQKNPNLAMDNYNLSNWKFEEEQNKASIPDQTNNTNENSKETILLVDNNIDLTQYMSNKLITKGHKCLTAQNGKQALEILESNEVNLVITDWVMDEMSGLELIRIMKNKNDFFSIPTILLTSKSDKESIIEGKSTGADAYLSKPFDGRELFSVVNNLINLKNNISTIERQKSQLEIAAKYSESLEEKVQTRTKMLSESLNKVNAIMDKIKMSIFTVDEDGKIKPPISKFSKNIFQKEILDLTLKDIFKIKDGSQTHLDLTSIFNLIFGSDEIQFLSLEDRLPEKISIPDETASKNKDLKVSYAPILDKDDEIESILCIVEDISDFETNFRQARKDQFYFKIINEILKKENKKDISTKIEDCINGALKTLDLFVSPTSDTFHQSFFIEKLISTFNQINNALGELKILKDTLKEKQLEIKTWEDIVGDFDFQLLSVEKVSEIIEILISYAHVSNIFFPVNFQFNFSFSSIILEKIENINNIFKNLFVYVPGLEQLDKVKLKHVAKVARMYPEFDRTMNLIHQRSKLISFLLKVMMEEELSIQFDNLANLIKEIPSQNKITESNLKHNLIAPYKKIMLQQESLIEKLSIRQK
ncbi:response regulator [Bacteriovoracales bacterium]|nr:response regulator [Bacteriovoracales bacterium]